MLVQCDRTPWGLIQQLQSARRISFRTAVHPFRNSLQTFTLQDLIISFQPVTTTSSYLCRRWELTARDTQREQVRSSIEFI